MNERDAVKAKRRIEDDEYSTKAAQESAQRTAQARAANHAQEQRNRQQGQRIAQELTETQRRARQPIEDEAALARSLLQLGAVLGVQPKIERRKRKSTP
jgi:predicted DsbA family dithiol-disulfide isomerase